MSEYKDTSDAMSEALEATQRKMILTDPVLAYLRAAADYWFYQEGDDTVSKAQELSDRMDELFEKLSEPAKITANLIVVAAYHPWL